MRPQVDNAWEERVYRQGRQINRWPYTTVVSGVMRALGKASRSQARILDLGCGTGNNLRFLAEEGFQAYGVDASQAAISIAEQQLGEWGLDAELQLADFTHLPFDDDCFDMVIDRAAIVHNEYAEILRTLDESRRVLKPGAQLLSVGLKGVNHPDRDYGRQIGPHTWSDFTAGKFETVGVTCFFEPDDIRGLFSGFSAVEVECHYVSGEDGRILDEEFEVRARK